MLNIQINILYGGLIQMENIKGKVALLQQLNWRFISKIAVALLVVGLFAWACISTSNTSDIQEKYTASRNAVAQSLYGCANMMLLEFDKIDLAGADIEGEIIPNIRHYYSQMQVVNNAMAAAYGEEYVIFDAELMKELALSLEEYDAAFATGHSTDSAHDRMSGAMSKVHSILNRRFDKNINLK